MLSFSHLFTLILNCQTAFVGMNFLVLKAINEPKEKKSFLKFW